MISIIVPVFNTPEWQLQKCFESILEQTYQDIEIVVIDDGSEQGVADTLDQYRERDRRLFVVHTENRGLSSARNEGLVRCKGSHVLFVDSDDILHPQAVEKLYDALVSTQSDMAIGGIVTASQYPKFSYNSLVEIQTEIMNSKDALERIMTGKIGTTACCRLATKEIWGKEPFIPGMLHEDLASMWKVYARCGKIVNCDADLYYYYFGTTSSIHQKAASEKFCWDFWKAMTLRRDGLLKLYPELEGAVSFSCLFYCPQIHCAVQNARNKEKLKELETMNRKLFLECWKQGEKYAHNARRALWKIRLFRVSPALYNLCYVVSRRLKHMRI